MKLELGRYTFSWALGTLGLRVGNWYGDFFLGGAFGGGRHLRRFVNDGIVRRWETLTWDGWVIDRLEVLHAENAARIFRRTMKPYYNIYDRHTGQVFVAMSYPCPNPNGTVTIMARTREDDPSSLVEMRCDCLGPVSFEPTNVPAENPLPV